MENQAIYEAKLRDAIKESFGYDFKELYDTLKDNIFDISIISSFIILTNELINRIEEQDKYENILHFKTCNQIINFITKFKDIYTYDKLNTIKFKNLDNDIVPIVIESNTQAYLSNEENYLDVVKEFPDLTPFEFVLMLLAKINKVNLYTKLFPELITICDIFLKYYNCGECKKFRFLEICKNCEPKPIEN